ncbi:MAG: electron transport complex subunit RsxC [Bacteroidales bacterium]|nr:electron transport complex subunit RsxC [Bacteroidales bacterium]
MLKTFTKGGVHPPENKLSGNKPIEKLGLPKQVSIPIAQHIGAPSTPVVNKKDKVKAGDIIAKSQGFVSSNIHASVSGTVSKVGEVMDTSGFRKPAVIINVEDDEWNDSIDTSSDIIRNISYSSQEIVDKILEAGIVGMGGATFPSHVKLSVPEGKKIDTLVINGVECEPYLTSDHRVMLERTEEMLIGVKLIKKALGVDRVLIGIERNKPDAVDHITNFVSEEEGMEVYPLKVKYPQGGEKQLIKALLDREVPSGGLPLDVGVVVHNVGTALAVYEALQKNKPLIERVVTVTGKSLSKPSNFMVRIGTPVKDLIEAAGGLPEDTGKIVSGGPMMGKALNSLDVPVVKGTSGILVIPEREAHRAEEFNCIRCGKCVDVCPMGLEPYLLKQLARLERYEECEENAIMDCMECGSCSFTCPARVPLLDYIRFGKTNVSQLIRNRKQK